MFLPKSVSLQKKRQSVLNQFSKALDGLKEVSEEITGAMNNTGLNIDRLEELKKNEEIEFSSLNDGLQQNERTIKKFEDLLR